MRRPRACFASTHSGWRAGRRPRSREGTRHTKNNGCATWRAISLAWRGEKEDGPPRGFDKEYGWRSVGCLTIESENRERKNTRAPHSAHSRALAGEATSLWRSGERESSTGSPLEPALGPAKPDPGAGTSGEWAASRHTVRRHGRTCSGHPRLFIRQGRQDVRDQFLNGRLSRRRSLAG